MAVKLTNISGRDLEIDDGRNGRLIIPVGQTVDYHADVASDEVRQLLAAGQIKIEDESDGD